MPAVRSGTSLIAGDGDGGVEGWRVVEGVEGGGSGGWRKWRGWMSGREEMSDAKFVETILC